MIPETSSNFSKHLVTFDTHAHIKNLIARGFDEQQAEGIIQSLLESRDYDLSQLATREQVALLEKTVQERFDRIEKEFKNELKAEIASVKYDILKWIIPMFVGIVGMMISIFIKLHYSVFAFSKLYLTLNTVSCISGLTGIIHITKYKLSQR